MNFQPTAIIALCKHSVSMITLSTRDRWRSRFGTLCQKQSSVLILLSAPFLNSKYLLLSVTYLQWLFISLSSWWSIYLQIPMT